MDKVWHSLPEAIINAENISDNFNVDLELGKYKYPIYDKR